MKQIFALVLIFLFFSFGLFSSLSVQAVAGGVCAPCDVASDCAIPSGICLGGDPATPDKQEGLCQKPTGIAICNPLQSTNFTGVVDKILNILFFVAIAVAPVMIIVAGFKFLTGGGNPETLQGARQMLIWTAVGFGIILLSKGIVMILRSVIGF